MSTWESAARRRFTRAAFLTAALGAALYATDAFAGRTRVTRVRVRGNRVILTLSRRVPTGARVTLRYRGDTMIRNRRRGDWVRPFKVTMRAGPSFPRPDPAPSR